jgi:hypothetical protein
MEEIAQAASRPQHEILVEQFMDLDKQCQDLISKFLDGRIIYESIPPDGAGTHKEFFEKMVVRYNAAQDHLKNLIEQRNAKLQEAGTAMRAQVMAGDTVVRGPDGKPSIMRYGPFEVASKTFRGFNVEKLVNGLKELGLFGRFEQLTNIDKDTGNPVPVMRVETKVDYKPTDNFLLENNLGAIRDAAYEEEEGTPAVTGPKPLGWIGEADKTAKKGKKG